jgi:glycosyltransferase involved in cell wall biosynthesis
MNEIGYPRILVIASEPFNWEYGGGITMSNLFMGWPKESIMTLYWSEISPDQSICAKNIKLIRSFRSPFKNFMPQFQQDINIHTINPIVDTFSQVAKKNNLFFLRNLLGRIDQNIGLKNWLYITEIPDSVKQLVAAFKPQVIFVVANASMVPYELVKSVRKIRKVPTVVHVYDDWVSLSLLRGGILGWLNNYVVRKKFIKCLRSSSTRITIGNQMSKKYSKMFGLNFLVFQNAPASEIWMMNEDIRNPWNECRSFIFRYIGAIYPKGNLNALLEFATAINSQMLRNVNVILEIYAPEMDVERCKVKFRNHDYCKVIPILKDTMKIAELYRSADGLLIAYDGHSFAMQWMGLSMPTKLPSSLLSGTPIFLYAPDSFAVSRLIREGNCGYFVPSPMDIELLSQNIKCFIENDSQRRAYASNARNLALREFAAETVRPRFQNILRETALSCEGCLG